MHRISFQAAFQKANMKQENTVIVSFFKNVRVAFRFFQNI